MLLAQKFTFPTEEGGTHPPLTSNHTPKPSLSTHSELPIFTILYNKYSDEFCENWQGPNDSPTKWHMLFFNKVPLDKDPGRAQKQGQWVSWGTPALAHTWGSEGGAG